jgi:hypothetical protein
VWGRKPTNQRRWGNEKLSLIWWRSWYLKQRTMCRGSSLASRGRVHYSFSLFLSLSLSVCVCVCVCAKNSHLVIQYSAAVQSQGKDIFTCVCVCVREREAPDLDKPASELRRIASQTSQVKSSQPKAKKCMKK